MMNSILFLALVSASAYPQTQENWPVATWSANDCRSALIVLALEHNGLNDCLLGLPRATLLQVFDRFRRACERTPVSEEPRINDLRPLFMRYYEGLCVGNAG